MRTDQNNARGRGAAWQRHSGGDSCWTSRLLEDDLSVPAGGSEEPAMVWPQRGDALPAVWGWTPRECVSHKNEGHWAIFIWTDLEEFSNS